MFRAALLVAALVPAAGLASPAHAAACPVPHSGLRACLDARWSVDHGDVTRVRARATLLERVDHCTPHPARRAIMRHGGTRLGALRTKPVCHRGVVRWQTTFTRTDTAGWELRKGDVLTLGWRGTQAIAAVKLTGGPPKR